MKKLDKLLKISSLAGIFLIFCGVLKLILYYNAFNIDIVDFLSLPEIITSFLDDINVLLVFAAAMLTVSFTVLSVTKEKHEIKLEDYLEQLLNKIYPFKQRYVWFFLVVIIILSLLLTFEILRYSYTIIYFMAFCAIQFISYLSMTKDESGKIEFPDVSMSFAILVSILVSVFLLAQHDIEKANYNDCVVTITTKTSTIECNNSNGKIYLGKTDSYVFIKSSLDNTSIVIPRSEICKFEFRKLGLKD